MADEARKKFAPSERIITGSLIIGFVVAPAASLIAGSAGIVGMAVVGGIMGAGLYGAQKLGKEISSKTPSAGAIVTNMRRYALRMPKRVWDVKQDRIVVGFTGKYHAISHVWHDGGDVITGYNIPWNPHKITRKQLEDTRNFLLSHKVLYAWVDNLCIDQRSVEGREEREQEMADMHIFYAKAESTIIFPHGLGHFRPEVGDDLDPGKWFDRVWTLQELMKSKKPMFAIARGNNRCLIPAHCMRSVLYEAIKSDTDLSKERCLTAFIDVNSHGTQKITLEDALYAAFKRGVTKEVDRVYGILGFMDDRSRSGFRIKDGEDLGYALVELLSKAQNEDLIAALSTITTGPLDRVNICYRYKLFNKHTKRACNLKIHDRKLVCKRAKVCALERTSVIHDVSRDKRLSPKDINKILSKHMADTRYSSAIGEYYGMTCTCGKCVNVSQFEVDVSASSINVDYEQYTKLHVDHDRNLLLVRIYKSSEGYAPSLGRMYTCIICEKQGDLYVKKGIAYVDSTFMKWTRQDITIGGVFDIRRSGVRKCIFA